MKVAFDAQPLLSDTKSGVGYNEHELVKELIKKYPDNQYSLEFFSWKNRLKKKKALAVYQMENTQLVECCWFPGSLYRMASTFFPIPYALFFPKKREITHFFNYYVPPFVRGKKVVTVHDMAFRVYPETVRKKTRIFLKLVIKKSIRRADRIVTDSEFSKQEILRFYKINPEKINVVPCGVDLKRFHPNFPHFQIQKVKQKYHIADKKYFLYLGTLEPRKNLVRLIQAYGIFLKKKKQENKTEIPLLVIAGGKGWMYEEIFAEVQKENLDKNIIFPGYIADEDVPVLMTGADLFCFPSLYEGFGMPVLEAMACGTMVLTSGESALGEIAKGAAYIVDPLNTKAIANGMLEAFQNSNIRKQYHEIGIEKAKNYSWEKLTERLHGMYIDVLDTKQGEICKF